MKTIATHSTPAWIPPATVYWTEPNGERRSQADTSVEAAELLAQRFLTKYLTRSMRRSQSIGMDAVRSSPRKKS